MPAEAAAEERTAYRDLYRRSSESPAQYWAEAASAIHWFRGWDRVLDDSRAPLYRWFPGGETNACFNAVDRHVISGRAGATALIHESPVTGQRRSLSFRELRAQIVRLSAAMLALGVARGDRVVIYMPMVPEAVFAMLACARIGAVHCVVFGGFAAAELAKRIDAATPRIVLTASCGIEPKGVVAYKPLLERALQLCRHRPACCIVLQREQLQAELIPGRDLDWRELPMGAADVGCAALPATDPLYILHTSGTTGVPKGVVRDLGGYLVALAWSMQHVYGMAAGDVFWAASDLGWVVGHSYIVYAPLIHGCATVLYEGKPVGTPDAGAYWDVARRNRVKCLFTSPTALRAIKRADPAGTFIGTDRPAALQYLFVAGERADPDTVRWAEARLGIPVFDHWWQTETGWPAAGHFAGLEAMPRKVGSAGRPVPGYDIAVLDAESRPLPAHQTGDIAIRLPLPPGCLPTLWQDDAGYIRSCLSRHAGYYTTGDAGYFDDDGFLYVMNRVDDVINVAGHRLSTGAIEEVVAGHTDVAECAVIGVPDELKGQMPLALVVLFPNAETRPQELFQQINDAVRAAIGSIAALTGVVVVERLPKTRSGKILRATLRKIAAGADYDVPATIEDETVLAEIGRALAGAGVRVMPVGRV